MLSSLASSCVDQDAAEDCREESDLMVWMRLFLLIEHERSAEDNKLTVVDTAHDVHTLQEEPRRAAKIRGRGGQRRETEGRHGLYLAIPQLNCSSVNKSKPGLRM